MTLTFDPIWPWSQLFSGESSSSVIGWFLSRGTSSLLVVVPVVLIALTAWTYFASGATRERVLTILLLRMLAFLIAAAAILRPSLGFSDRNAQRGMLLVALDSSESMTILDEIDSQSRWAYLLKLLKDSGASMDQLQESQNVDVVFYRFAGDTTPIQVNDPGLPDGKRTDIGGMLRYLYENRDGQRRLLSLLVLTDGADNGTRVPALTEAVRWRNLPCPIHPFAFGKTTTSDRRSDIAMTAIASQPAPVPVKALLTVKATIDAPGFENRRVRIKLFINDKEVKAQDETLPLTLGNEVRLTTNAPDKPGEIKVTVRVEDPRRPGQPLEGEVSATNNEISTYVTVSKEGLRVLIVDKPRAGEPQAISDALSRDARIRVSHVWLRGDQAVDPATAALLDFEKNPYDVIIMGDVTAQQLAAANPRAMSHINQHVERGMGFVMLGGYNSFGNGDWLGTPIANLLPVDLSTRGQVDGRDVRMTPTEAGIRRFGYMLRLTDKPEDPLKAWASLKPLEGMTRMGKPRDALGVVLATADDGEPLLVTKNYGDGRVLAFGGDTTYRWVRSVETRDMQRRFWQRLVIWLAKQDEAEGSVWVMPDTRRLPIRNDLGFTIGMKSKTGTPITNGVSFKAEVIDPASKTSPVSTAKSGTEQRGTFNKADAPGEYRIHVTGEGKDDSGEDVKGEATVRFLVYDEDVEMLRRAADHEFLRKLATAGGGKFHQADEFPGFVRELQNQPDTKWRAKLNLWPNWRATTRSPFLGFFFVLFVIVVSGEWFLRRRWGMV